MTKGVYLLHFSANFSHARHYIGYADDIEARVEEHRKGRGACLVRAVVAANITVECVRTWPRQKRKFERKLKNRKGANFLCPICNPLHWATNASLRKRSAK
jgi:predicted GIY-YIG superfamily endonuclease